MSDQQQIIDELGAVQASVSLPMSKWLTIQNHLLRCGCGPCLNAAATITETLSQALLHADLPARIIAHVDQCMAHDHSQIRTAVLAHAFLQAMQPCVESMEDLERVIALTKEMFTDLDMSLSLDELRQIVIERANSYAATWSVDHGGDK